MRRMVGTLLLAAGAAASWAQDEDPFGGTSSGGGKPPVSGGGGAAPGGPFEGLTKALGSMTATDKLVLGFSLVGAWLLGWAIFAFLVRRRSLPSNAARFGCFWTAALWLSFVAFVFFVYIVPASLPQWIGYAVLGTLVVWLLILLITRKKR